MGSGNRRQARRQARKVDVMRVGSTTFVGSKRYFEQGVDLCRHLQPIVPLDGMRALAIIAHAVWTPLARCPREVDPALRRKLEGLESFTTCDEHRTTAARPRDRQPID